MDVQKQKENNSQYATKMQNTIDAKILHSYSKNMGENASKILAALIECYLEEAAKLLHSMSTAATSKEATQLQRTAHTLKGSSAGIGATNLANLCQELEAMCRAGTIAGASEKFLQVEAEYEQVKAALQMEYQRCQA
jgi:HPt (histidine-containing phosphotransfer) domain-containing protein